MHSRLTHTTHRWAGVLHGGLLSHGRFLAALCLPFLLLTACVTDEKNVQLDPLVEFDTPYKQPLVMKSTNSPLGAAAIQAFQTSALAVPTLEPQQALTLNLALSTTPLSQPQEAVSLAGLLETISQTYQHTVSYTLTDKQGKTLTSGTTTVNTQPHTQISSLGNTQQLPAPTQAELGRLLNPVLLEIQPHLQAQPWYAQVISVLDQQHVALNVNEKHGLRLHHILQTETRPISKLEVVTFEIYATGQERAILRLINGPLPRAGQLLVSAF